MELVAGATGSVALKLLQLLRDEYELQKGVKDQVASLAQELESTHVALCKVAQVPYDQLDPQVKLWASEAREASYDMEDILDTFFVRVHGCHQPTGTDGKVRRLLKKMRKMFKLKARHEIADAIEDIKKRVDEMAKRRARDKVDAVVANSAATISIDPRVLMFHRTKTSELVGIDEPRDEIIKMLTLGDDDDDDTSRKKMKIVSVVGSGGLGKTTLAKVVYEKLTADMNIYCKAFVPVGQNPDLKKVFRDILLNLDNHKYVNIPNFTILDEIQLIQEIHDFLKEKRYFIAIDDVWEVKSWDLIRTALEDNHSGSTIMVTTRSGDVAKLVHRTYKMQPLLPESSKILFYGRIFGSQDRCPKFLSELSDTILKKCNGVPLAIITIASLLANKKDDITEWQKVCSSIGSGLSSSSSNNMYSDMRKILSLSYYDLPSHMKTCFLYLSMYPEDCEIKMDPLIWKWISEGFIQPQEIGDDLFELGKSYFHDLINRSLVQPVEDRLGEISTCRVHDTILDLICFLSREENLVTTSDYIEQVMSLESKKLRRLSLKSSTTWPKKGVAQVRSIVIFSPSIDSVPSFSCLGMLRVLDLENCRLGNCEGSNKLYIGNLIHLRYLGLRGTGIKVLPGGIEKLQFLQVLKVSEDMELPVSIFGLRRLMCIEGVWCCPCPENLRNLVSLEVLHTLYVDKDHAAVTVEALGHLTQLTNLRIRMDSETVDQSICDAFIDSLGNLPRLKNLWILGGSNINIIKWECWAPPPQLRMVGDIFSWTLPKWISPASLPHLIELSIVVHTVGPEDIQILGTLPDLRVLLLRADHQNYLDQPLQKFVVSADAFPRLRICYLWNVGIVPSMFTRGAMPWVEFFCFSLRARDFFSNPSKGLDFDDLAMDHLPSLGDVRISIEGKSDVTREEVKKLREALWHAADVHPNHPFLVCWIEKSIQDIDKTRGTWRGCAIQLEDHGCSHPQEIGAGLIGERVKHLFAS